MYKSLEKNKNLIFITETILGSASAVIIFKISILHLCVGVFLLSSTALLVFFGILVIKGYITKLKIRYAKLMDWIIVSVSQYEKTLKQPMIDEKVDQGEVEETKTIYI